MANDAQNIGTLHAEAEIDFGKFEGDVKKLDQVLGQLDPASKKVEQGLKKVEQASSQASQGMQKVSVASRAMSVALGVAGVNSIQSIIFKVVNLTREAFNLSIQLDAVASQARSVFGEAFPQMVREADRLAAAYKRGSSEMLQYMAGFGDFLDQLGMAPKQTQQMSVALTEMTVQYGKLKANFSDQQIFDALQAGLAGNYKALRQLDILIKDETLQAFADLHGASKNKVKDLDAEQKAVLISLYLQDDLANKQKEVAAATGKAGDAAKSAAAAWMDLKEAFGQGIGPFVAKSLDVITVAMRFAMDQANMLKEVILGLPGVRTAVNVQKVGIGGINSLSKLLGGGQQANTVPFGPATPSADQWAILNRKPRADGSGGGGKSLEDQFKEAEKAMADALKEQVDVNLENVKLRREELVLRRELGTLTVKESRELDKINGRLEFKKDAIDDATEAWREQVEELKKVEQRIADINEKIVEEKKNLAESLKDIDKDVAKSKTETYIKLFKELEDINKEQASMASGDWDPEKYAENASRKSKIETTLDKIRNEKGGSDIAGEAGKLMKMNEFELIDYEAEQRKKEEQDKSDARMKDLNEELAAEQAKLEKVRAAEEEKKQIVMNALNERLNVTIANFAVEQEVTTAHVNAMVAQYNRLAAAMRNATKGGSDVPAVGLATGGMVVGPGGPTDDSVPAMLSNGEYVVRASAARMYMPLLDRINAMGLPRFAKGGSVSTDNSVHKTANAQFHFHGDTAKVAASPALMRWHLRRSI